MDSQPVNITIPDNVSFSDLNLQRDPDGGVSFDWPPIDAICRASGIDPRMFRDAPEDNVCSLIIAWYMERRARGGDLEPVVEDLIQEAQFEDAAGSLSHAPGRA